MIINEIVPAKVAFPPATDVNGTVAAPQTTEEESLHPASIQKQRGAPSAGYTIQYSWERRFAISQSKRRSPG